MRAMMCAAFIAIVLVIFIGCAATKGDWRTIEIPTDSTMLFANGLGESANLQLAIDKAAMNARTEIGRQLELKLNDLQKLFAEEIGNTDPELRTMYTAATKQVVSLVLKGSKIRQQKYREVKGRYEAITQVEYPIGAANAVLMDEIRKNDSLYTEFKASKAFKELEAEVEKYELEKKAE